MTLLLALLLNAECKTLVPTSSYDRRTIGGFTVYVNKTLDKDAIALEILTQRLNETKLLVPPAVHVKLKEVPFWLGVDDGPDRPASYHPDANWLATHKCNPEKAKGIDIGNARFFESIAQSQPMVVMHELAHAYYDRVLGHDARIKGAYDAAVIGRRYESVMWADGRIARHYALTNEDEYFAEGTEAYLGENDGFPFVRAELMTHDPTLFLLLETIWGKPKDDSVVLKVTNKRATSIQLYWQTREGKWDLRFSVAPFVTEEARTYIGHRWQAKDGDVVLGELTAAQDYMWLIGAPSK